MSMESAMAALAGQQAPSESLKSGLEGSITQKQGVEAPQPIPEGPKTLQEAVNPVKSEPAQPGVGRFTALAKKERQLQKQMAELKQQQARLAQFEKARSEAAQNPLKALESLGLSYEQITQFLLNNNKPTPELELQGVKQEIERLRQETALKEQRAKQAQEQAAKAEYQRTLQEFSQEVSDYLDENAGTYELTKMYEGQSIIQATIEQYFAQTKKIMSIEDAAKLVEKYFEDQVEAAQKTKKFQAKQTPKEDKGQPRREPAVKNSPTLANELTSSAPSLLPAKTESDRLQRALAALDKGR
jgi:hypothetical protein